MTVDILAIAAHRDDVEGTCGGLLIKHARLGYKTGVVDLTQGEMGTRGTAIERAREAEAAAKVMGLSFRENLKLPDAGVTVTKETIKKLQRVIRRVKPRVVILPHWVGRHPDHYVTSDLGWQASFFAGLKKYDTGLPPHRPSKVLFTMGHHQIVPSFVIDITEDFEKKMASVMCYRSQFLDERIKGVFPPPDRLKRWMSSRSTYYGSLIGAEYGEAYVIREMIRVDDVMAMPVKSM